MSEVGRLEFLALVLEDSEHSGKAFYLVHVGTFLLDDNHKWFARAYAVVHWPIVELHCESSL